MLYCIGPLILFGGLTFFVVAVLEDKHLKMVVWDLVL